MLFSLKDGFFRLFIMKSSIRKNLQKEFGKKLVLARKQAGLTQSRLAEKLSVESSTVQRWEGGQFLPSQSKLEKLLEFLELPIDYFLGDEKKVYDPVDTRIQSRMASLIADLQSQIEEKSRLLENYHSILPGKLQLLKDVFKVVPKDILDSLSLRKMSDKKWNEIRAVLGIEKAKSSRVVSRKKNAI